MSKSGVFGDGLDVAAALGHAACAGGAAAARAGGHGWRGRGFEVVGGDIAGGAIGQLDLAEAELALEKGDALAAGQRGIGPERLRGAVLVEFGALGARST